MPTTFCDSTTGSDANAGTVHTSPKATLAAAITAAGNGGLVWVRNIHNENTNAPITLACPTTPINTVTVCCTSDWGASPSTVTTGAIVGTANANVLTINGHGYFYGIFLNSGSGGNSANLALNGAGGACSLTFEKCVLSLGTTGSSILQLGNFTASQNQVLFIDTKLKFGATGQTVNLRSRSEWRDISTLFDTGSVTPTTLFTANVGGVHEFHGVNFTPLSGSYTLIDMAASVSVDFSCYNCRIPSTVTIPSSTMPGPGATRLKFYNCSSTGNTHNEQAVFHGGSFIKETGVFITDGLKTDTVETTVRMASSANVTFANPLIFNPISTWNDTTGASKTVTIEIASNTGSLLTNRDFWANVAFPGESSSPRAFYTSNRSIPGVAGSNLETSSAVWGAATTRSNGIAISTGSFLKVASNPNLIFICTAGGTLATPEPAGYATAVDGSSITDGGATVVAMRRQKITLSLTPQLKGLISVFLNLAQASRTVFIGKVSVT